MHQTKLDSPFILYVRSLLPECLHQLSHVLCMLLVDPRQLVVEVAHCKYHSYQIIRKNNVHTSWKFCWINQSLD